MGRKHTPGVAVQFKKDWQLQPIAYKTLTVESMSKADKEYIVKELAKVSTGEDAKKFLSERIKLEDTRWSIRILDMLGNVMSITFKGVEVAVYFKRQITEIKPEPGDPIPENILKEPDDAWQRLDLFGISARQARRLTLERAQDQGALIASLKSELEAQRKINETWEDADRKRLIKEEIKKQIVDEKKRREKEAEKKAAQKKFKPRKKK